MRLREMYASEQPSIRPHVIWQHVACCLLIAVQFATANPVTASELTLGPPDQEGGDDQPGDPFALGPDFDEIVSQSTSDVSASSEGDQELVSQTQQSDAPKSSINGTSEATAADSVEPPGGSEVSSTPPQPRDVDSALPEVENPASEEPQGDEIEFDEPDLEMPRGERKTSPLDDLQPKKVAWIEVEGPIFGRFHWYLLNRIEWAKDLGADVVVIDLTSPGGELNMSVELGREIAAIDWAKTICFVRREAISGGAITALGADYIVMQDGAMIGDAGPIELREGGVFEHAPEKIVSYLAPIMGELASQNGRPAVLAEAMVDRSLTVFEAIDVEAGARVFVSEKTLEDSPERYQDAKQIDETGRNRFLTVAAERALELELCEETVAGESALIELLGEPDITRTNLTGTDETVYLLNRPWMTALLLVIGLIGIYLEAAAPGISVAGLTAAICFGIFFWSHALGGTAGVLEILLFVLGVGCIVCEVLVLPGFGVFGITGIGLVAASLVMATQTFVIPETSADWKSLQVNSVVVLGAMMLVFGLGVAQILLFDSLPGLNLFRLQAPVEAIVDVDSGPSSLTQAAPPVVPIELGMEGHAESDLRPAGKIAIDGHLVDVVTEGDYVEKGRKVSVIRIEGNRVTVRVI